MVILSKEAKLLTLYLILHTMPKTQQTLLMSHFKPDVVSRLSQLEQESASDVEKLDWTPFYESWPELQKILYECKEEIRSQKLYRFAEEQRPKLREYLLVKLGRGRKGAPIFLSQEIIKAIDQFILNLGKD